MSAMEWIGTRAAGLARLQAFLPRAGRAYARTRNDDLGPADRSNVSCLSPWIRRRLITEDEVLDAALRAHSPAAAEKFIQEIYWRTYWKGWLEMRPQVLARFNDERIAFKAGLQHDRDLAARVERAKAGETGIACFDAWTRELIEIGWLHNHARMWYASIWIFTLRLPWQIGSDFFFKHLLDADPASNTLSWRWVAGLHTRGKHYVARAANIREHTNGRFDPHGELDERPAPLTEAPADIARRPIPPVRHACGPALLLLHEDDLHAESLPLDGIDVRGVAVLRSPQIESPTRPAARFNDAALEDGVARAQQQFNVPSAGLLDAAALASWAHDAGMSTIVSPYAPRGLIAWELEATAAARAEARVDLVPIRRGYDERAWPFATGGFFTLKERIPALLAAR